MRDYFSNVLAFDDAPFTHDYAGNVKIVGAFFAGLRLDGVVLGEVEKDGFDAAEQLAALVAQSKFAQHIQLVMLQGIALAGFNVVDVFQLHEQLGLPVLVVSRRLPDLPAVREALLTRIHDGERKWAVIAQLGQMEPAANVYVQRVGLSLDQAHNTIERFAIHGNIPEPIRVAHLIAGALVTGESRGNP